MRITLVGSSAGVPTSDYGTSGVFAQVGKKSLLFDCGEGTQQRLMKYDCSINIDAVFLSHFDTDHTLGLPGLIRTLDMNNRTKPLDVHASEDIIENVKLLVAGPHGMPSYGLNFKSFKKGSGEVTDYDGFNIQHFKTVHDNSSHGYIIQEDERRGRLDAEKIDQEYNLPPSHKYQKLKNGSSVVDDDGRTIEPEDVVGPSRDGRKIVYTGDCRTNERVEAAAQGADLLVHESTFHSDHKKKAKNAKHSTAFQAGKVAANSDVDRLVLTHISPRYEGEENRLIEDAKRAYNGKVDVGRDGFCADITLS